jgi:hypothetical protein
MNYNDIKNVSCAENYLKQFSNFREFLESNTLGIDKRSNINLTLYLIAWKLIGGNPVECSTTYSMTSPYDTIFKEDKVMFDTLYTVVAHSLYVMIHDDLTINDVKRILHSIHFNPGLDITVYTFCNSIFPYIEDENIISKFVKGNSKGVIENKSIQPIIKDKVTEINNLKLLSEMFEDLGDSFTTRFIEESALPKADDPNSNNNEDELLGEIFGICYIYNKVMFSELKNWGAGYKAFLKIPKVKAYHFEAAFRKISDIRNSTGILVNAKTEKEVIDIIIKWSHE